MNKKEAKRLKKWMQNSRGRKSYSFKIYKIKYSNGIGRHDEHNCISGKVFDTALCKSFTILKELKEA
jgi:hypothetical protein